MRVKHQIVINVARDSDLKNKLFSNDETLAQVIADNFDHVVSGNLSIAANTSESVPLGDVDQPRAIYLEVTGDPTIKINGSGDAIQLRKAGSSASDVAKFFLEAELSSVEITAAVADAVTGVFVLWGDPQ